MSSIELSPWQEPRQAFMAIRYLCQPRDDIEMTDVRQPYPYEVGVWVREGGQLVEKHQFTLLPVMPYHGMGRAVFTDSHSPEPEGLQSWEEVSASIEQVLINVSAVITHGEGRLIDAYRQLNSLSVRQGTLHDQRVCVDGLTRLAGLGGLPKDQWGYFLATEAAEEAGVSFAQEPSTPIEETLSATLALFDWAHQKMKGMNYESSAAGDPADKVGEYPIHLPKKTNFSCEPYQVEAIGKSLQHAEYGRGGLSVMPTGSGKTILSAVRNASILRANPGMRVMVLAENPKILRQMVKTYRDLYPEFSVTRCFSGERDMSGQVVVASRQQLGYMAHEVAKAEFGIVDVDEAHHAASDQYTWILDELKNTNPKILVFGETATPRRPDGKSLRPVFGQVTGLVRLQEVRKTGRIVDLEVVRDDQMSAKDLERMEELSARKSFGNSGAIDNAISDVLNTEANNQRIVRLYKRHAGKRLTVVYAVNIRHAEAIGEEFRKSGVQCEVVHSKDGRSEASRANVLAQFEGKHFPVLINVMSLTEGWDCPPASCAIIARPCHHPSILEQMVGRILRSCKGKRNAMLIEVGVNRDSLNQFMYQFFDHSLGMKGIRVKKAGANKGKHSLQSGEVGATEDIPMDLTCGDWIPPLLALGGGWLGFRLNGRLMACKVDRGAWVSLEAPDKESLSAPTYEEAKSLAEMTARIKKKWSDYRSFKMGSSMRAVAYDEGMQKTLMRKWMCRLLYKRHYQKKEQARAGVRQTLSDLRSSPEYQQYYGVHLRHHEDVDEFYQWLREKWLPALNQLHGHEELLGELRAPPESTDSPVAHRYHERLLKSVATSWPRLEREMNCWRHKTRHCYGSSIEDIRELPVNGCGSQKTTRPLPATSPAKALSRIWQAVGVDWRGVQE